MSEPVIRRIKTNSILTRSGLPVSDYSVNPYVGCTHACKYCYACFMKRFTDHPEAWGEFLDVKYWEPIRDPQRYEGKELFLGSVTDPYNPQEEIYQRTRALLQELQGSGVKLSIQTKSDLVLRDIDLIKSFPDPRVGFSINTLDEDFRSDMDKAVSIARRLSAMRSLHDAGIRTTCFISPIFPGITDVEAIVKCVREQCNLIWLENLNLRGGYKTVISEYIRKKRPDLLPLYEEIYDHRSRRYWEQLDSRLKDLAGELGLEYRRNDDTMQREFDEPPVLVNFFYHEEIKRSAARRTRP